MCGQASLPRPAQPAAQSGMAKDWMPLLVGALTALTTLSGVVLTQWRSDRREAARARDEASREAVRLSREDHARVFEHRRAAYTYFLSGVGASMSALSEFYERHPGDDPPENALEGLWSRLTTVKI